jgi:hypothetical protein
MKFKLKPKCCTGTCDIVCNKINTEILKTNYFYLIIFISFVYLNLNFYEQERRLEYVSTNIAS